MRQFHIVSAHCALCPNSTHLPSSSPFSQVISFHLAPLLQVLVFTSLKWLLSLLLRHSSPIIYSPLGRFSWKESSKIHPQWLFGMMTTSCEFFFGSVELSWRIRPRLISLACLELMLETGWNSWLLFMSTQVKASINCLTLYHHLFVFLCLLSLVSLILAWIRTE